MNLIVNVAFCLEVNIDEIREIRKELVTDLKEQQLADVILDFSGYVPMEATKQLKFYLKQHEQWHENIERCIDFFHGSHLCRLHWFHYLNSEHHWEKKKARQIEHISEMSLYKPNTNVWILSKKKEQLKVSNCNQLILIETHRNAHYIILEWNANTKKIQTKELLFENPNDYLNPIFL